MSSAVGAREDPKLLHPLAEGRYVNHAFSLRSGCDFGCWSVCRDT